MGVELDEAATPMTIMATATTRRTAMFQCSKNRKRRSAPRDWLIFLPKILSAPLRRHHVEVYSKNEAKAFMNMWRTCGVLILEGL
jgi:hypothetical protein